MRSGSTTPSRSREEDVGLDRKSSASNPDKDKEQGSESNNYHSAENSNGKGKDQTFATAETDESTREAPQSGNPDTADTATVESQHQRGSALSEEAARPTAGREVQAESNLTPTYGQQGRTLSESPTAAPEGLPCNASTSVGSGGRQNTEYWNGSDAAEDKETEDKFYRDSRDMQLWGDFNYNSESHNGETLPHRTGASRGYSPENEQESDYDADTEQSQFNPKDSNRDGDRYGEEAKDSSTSAPLRSAEIERGLNNEAKAKESGPSYEDNVASEDNSSSVFSKDKGKGKETDRVGDSSIHEPASSDAENPSSTEDSVPQGSEEVEKDPDPAPSTGGSPSKDDKGKGKAKDHDSVDIESSNTTPLTTEPQNDPAVTESGNGEDDVDEDSSSKPFSYLPTRRGVIFRDMGSYYEATPRYKPSED